MKFVDYYFKIVIYWSTIIMRIFSCVPTFVTGSAVCPSMDCNLSSSLNKKCFYIYIKFTHGKLIHNLMSWDM